MAVVLIVDDSSYQRRVIRKMVQRAGYQAMEVPDGQEALKVIPSKVPDCILMDLIMPVISGLGVLKALAGQGSRIPVIVVTADIQESVRKQCLELGARAVLNKPVNEDELLSAIRNALNSKVDASK
jgi:CheY-like chemotaxis protein